MNSKVGVRDSLAEPHRGQKVDGRGPPSPIASVAYATGVYKKKSTAILVPRFAM